MNISEQLFWDRPCPLCGGTRKTVLRDANWASEQNVEEIARIYCSSSETKLMDPLVRCDECGCQYLSPCLHPEKIQEGYTDAVDPVFVTQNPFRIATFTRTLQSISQRVALPEGSRILDVGCAEGAFPKAAKDLGFNPVGIEPSRWMCEFAKKEYQLDVRQGTLEEQHFADEKFDMVTLWDVLEHVAEPAVTLKLVHKLLSSEGTLVLTYPDISGWPARLMGSRWPFLLSVHLTYYTPETITRQLAETGFVVHSIVPYWQTLSLGYALKRAAQVSKLFTPLFNGLGWLATKVNCEKMAFRYYMSQTLVIAKPI